LASAVDDTNTKPVWKFWEIFLNFQFVFSVKKVREVYFLLVKG